MASLSVLFRLTDQMNSNQNSRFKTLTFIIYRSFKYRRNNIKVFLIELTLVLNFQSIVGLVLNSIKCPRHIHDENFKHRMDTFLSCKQI